MNSLDLQELSNHNGFVTRVKMMLISIGHDIVAESLTTAYTHIRKPYAVQILNNVDSFAQRFALSLSTQPNISQNISINESDPTVLDYTGLQVAVTEFDAIDIEIKSVISSVFNNLAGIYNL